MHLLKLKKTKCNRHLLLLTWVWHYSRYGLAKAVTKNKQQEVITPNHSLLQPEIFRLKFSDLLGYILTSLLTTIFYSFILFNLDNPDHWIALLAIWFWQLIIFITMTRPISITASETGIVIKHLLCRSIKLQWQAIIEVELKTFNAGRDI